jgi:ribose 5-phosphate isomerase A
MLERNAKNFSKECAGRAAADLIKNGMVVGLGTGTTAKYFIDSLIQRCQKGLEITAIATSKQSEEQAKAGGIPLLDIKKLKTLDLTVDGADEIDAHKQMIKGGGGALLREKIIASYSRELIIIVDEDKVVDKLGIFPLPLEILPFAHEALLRKMQTLGYHASLRQKGNQELYVTDNGNYIMDIHFPSGCDDPKKDNDIFRNIPGVLETGFFLQMAGRVLIGCKDGSVTESFKKVFDRKREQDQYHVEL